MRRTKEDAENTRQAVLEAALTLFSRDGYSLTTLSRIAREAGFSRGPIYWHFDSKDDLYEAVLSYSQEPLEALVAECRAMANTPIDAMDHFIERWLWLRERKLTRSIVTLFRSLIASAVSKGLLDTDEDPEKLGLLSYTYLMGITQSWLFSPELFALAQEMSFFQRKFWNLLTASRTV